MIIQYKKVYEGRNTDLVYMAMEDSCNDEIPVTFLDLKTGEITSEYSHQMREMQEDQAREYTQSEILHRDPDWRAKVWFYREEERREKFGVFVWYINQSEFNRDVKNLNDLERQMDDLFFQMLDKRIENKTFEKIEKIRQQHQRAKDEIYESGAIIS